MNWLNSREELKHRCESFRDFGHFDKISKKDRSKILTDNNYSCRYCGGIYPKYLMSTYIPHSKVSDVACRMCFLITHLNYGFYNEMKIYYSEMSQLDIVKNTVKYILDNNEIPEPLTIDINLKTSPLSMLEYINILNNYEVQPEVLANYKIFFSKKLNIDFIVNNYANQMVTFIDTTSTAKDMKGMKDTKDVKNNKNNNIILKKHIPTKEELALFNKSFKNV